MTPLVIAIILLTAGVLLVTLDIFLPSGGTLMMLAILCGIGAILFGFRHSSMAGMSVALIALALVPAFLWCFVRFWPKTPLGRSILIGLPEKESFTWSDGSTLKDIKQLIGRTGRAESGLFPSGVVLIENHRFEAISDSQGIEAGTPVRVVRIDMGRVVVTASESPPSPAPGPTADQPNLLDQPIEALGLESIEEEK